MSAPALTPPPPAAAITDATVCIGVFDSGVGGLSVLRALRAALPRARLLYVADSAHAPYGERDEAYVVDRAERIAAHLLREGAQMIVVACNTATAAAVAGLRAAHPGLPIVGVEPGLKPAIALSRDGRIGVMATTGTLRSDKFRRLMADHARDVTVHLQACPGLAHAIEVGEPDSPQVQALVAEHAAPLVAHGVDTVVLGCTHYPFALAALAASFGPRVALVDTAEAVARQSARLAASLPACPAAQTADGPSPIRLWTSGDPSQLRSFALRWLGFEGPVDALPAAPTIG
jgi:glutamate racemase